MAMAERVKDGLALTGAVLLIAAAALFNPLAGLAVAGVVLIAVAFLIAL